MSVQRMGAVVLVLSLVAVASAAAAVWTTARIDRALTVPAPPVKRRRWLR